MFATKLSVLFAILAAAAATDNEIFNAATEQCSKQLSTTLEEVKLNKGTEPYFCFIKCFNENLGTLRRDGVLDMEKFKNCPNTQKVEESERGPLIECVGRVGRVANCNDMKGFTDCFSNIKSIDLGGLF